MEKPKRPRVELTVAQKQEICRYYQKYPTKTMKQLKEHFSSYFGLVIGLSTIGTIVSRAEHWNSIEFPDNVRRTQSTKFAHLERDLFDWICKQVDAVTDDQILDKAAELLQEDQNLAKEWNKLRGWFTSYKRRFNLVLENDDGNDGEKRYRPGKMPEEREPIHRVQSTRKGRPIKYSPPQGPMHINSTSSIIYDAAIENILQDVDDTSDIDADPYDGSEERESTSAVIPSTFNASSDIGQVKREGRIRTRSTSRKRTSNSIEQQGAMNENKQNALVNETELSMEESQGGANPVTTISGTEVFPVVIHTQGSVSTTTVTLPNAQSAMKTLLTYFEQNPNTSLDDHNRLHALDSKLKWLAAKEAVSNLRTYLSTDRKYQSDVKNLNDLDKRLEGK